MTQTRERPAGTAQWRGRTGPMKAAPAEPKASHTQIGLSLRRSHLPTGVGLIGLAAGDKGDR